MQDQEPQGQELAIADEAYFCSCPGTSGSFHLCQDKESRTSFKPPLIQNLLLTT